MSNARIGALRVDLGVNTAAFQKGMDAASRKLNAFSDNMKKIGKRISGIGQSLSIGITAPVAAAGAAFSAAAHKMAADSSEMAKSAQVAGESFEEFQRQAFAARTVGIEFEKLGDIFKDVRDRVGDFVATGGGPMADFFENIAPKVGITADAFKGLSGKDALQLYFNSLKQANVSQEEMVFYLEAMASDATNLIPLLEQNGKAMGELGKNANVISDEDAANLEKYTKAQERLGQAMQKLTIAVVDSGILETVTGLVDRFAKFTSSLAETNPGILKAGVVFAGLAAAVGPVVMVIGQVVALAGPVAKAFSVIRIAALALMANPVILGFAAVVGGIYLAWQNWDKIEPYITAVKDAVVSFWNAHLEPIFTAIKDALFATIERWWNLAKGIANALSSAGKAIWDWHSSVRAQLMEVGRDMMRGLVNAILAAKDAVWNALKQTVGYGVEKVKEFLGIQSPSLLFMEIGEFMTEGLAKGILAGGDMVADALTDVASKAEVQTVRVAQTFREMTDSIMGSLRGLANDIKSGDIFGILEGAFGIFTQLGSAGAFGSGLASRLNSVPAFANGTPFHRGGLALVGERGPELVNLNRGASVMTNRETTRTVGGGRIDLFVHPSGEFDTRVEGVSARVVREAAPALVSASTESAVAKVGRIGSRRLS